MSLIRINNNYSFLLPSLRGQIGKNVYSWATIQYGSRATDRLGMQMQRIWEQSSSDNIHQWSAAFVKMKIVLLATYWNEYQRQQSALMLEFSDDDDQLRYMESTTHMAAEVYENTLELLDNRLKDMATPVFPPPLPPPKPSEIVLQKFDGDYTTWSAWRSQFVSRVYDTTLPIHSKLDLLFSALTGEAKLCAGIVDGRDEADLHRVWAKLSQVYDNKYQLVGAHCGSILDLPVLTKADPAAIRRMVDVFEKETDALKRFDFDVDAWSPFLAVIMLRKLDDQTRSDWEMSRDVSQVQSLFKVTAFLEKKIQALRNRTAATENKKEVNVELSGSFKRSHDDSNNHRHKKDKRHKPNNHLNSEVKSAQQSEKPLCNLCKDKNHYLWQCAPFRALGLSERVERVNSWKMCPCCLVKKHSSESCEASGCSRCNGAKHNNMLCPKYTVFRTNHLRASRRRHAHGNGNSQQE